MARRVSIFSVAQKARCSIATVSNVLNGKGRVGTEKRKVVLRAARALGYQTNAAGRNLRMQKSEMLGLLFYPSCSQIFKNPFYAEIMEGLESRLTRESYHLLLAGYNVAATDSPVPDFVTRGKVDGMILLGRFPSRILQSFFEMSSPLLLLDSNAEWPIDSAISDGFSAEIGVVQHLFSRGHRSIVFVAYNYEDYNIDLRVQGFLAGMQRCGLEGGEKNVIRQYLDHQEMYDSLRKRLNGPTPPTAIVAVNDTLAMILVERLRKDGIRVPDDVSIVGYDDDEKFVTLDGQPFLTTVKVDKAELGVTGAELILNRVRNPSAPVVKLRLPIEIVSRRSVATLTVPG